MNEILKCLERCEEQNGLPCCKNCGLSQEMIDEFAAEVRRGMARSIRVAIEERLKIIEGIYDKQMEQRIHRKEEVKLLMSIVQDAVDKQ